MLLVLSSVAACRHGNGRRVAVSDDGHAAIVGGQSWHAPEGVTFFERRGVLHVVSLVPGTTFDVAVPLDPAGRPVVPANAPFELRDGVVVLRERGLPPTARLVDSGQLYLHDDHFHLTHLWENPDWQALYGARAEGSQLPAATRQAAAFALATLLDQRIPGSDEEATAQAMRRMAEVVARARRAVEGASPAKQIMAMVLHDLEIQDGGAALSIEGKLFKAAPGLRFSYCGDHFHVEDAGGAWSHAISLDAAEPGAFEMPPSMFFETNGAVVAARAGSATWKELLAGGGMKLVGDRWFVTESYALPAFARLKQATRDPAVPPALQDLARRSVLEVLGIPLDVESDAAFQARLAGIDARIASRLQELEARLRAPRQR